MRGLHDIRTSSSQRWMWARLYGVQNRPIGPRSPGGSHYNHIWLINRATPPPILDPRRRYWNPWGISWDRGHSFTRPFLLNPLCGRISTTSPRPRLTHATNGWSHTECPNCVRVATEQGIVAQFADELNINDPWHLIPLHDRDNTPDPITGL